MDLSIVIPVSGRSNYLDRCLETILRQESLRGAIAAEVIVVDNAAISELSDATKLACESARRRHSQAKITLKYIRARHSKASHRNASYPLNVGIKLSRGHVVLITAADVLHVSDTLGQHLHSHDQVPKLMLFSFCRDCPADIALDPQALRTAIKDERHQLRMASWTDWYGGMCCSIKREHLLAVGGFEEKFYRWGYEDYDLARRLQLISVSVVRDDNILTLHQAHPSSGESGWPMKAYAGVRQLLRIRRANRCRSWGQVTTQPCLIE